MIEPISIRGHHLFAIGLDVSLEEYGSWLVSHRYSNSKDHPFIVKTYYFLKGLRENPNTKVIIVNRQPDFICINCPREKRQKECTDIGRNNQLYNTAFWDPKVLDYDESQATKLGLTIGNVYTIEEIIKATKEKTREIKESIGVLY